MKKVQRKPIYLASAALALSLLVGSLVKFRTEPVAPQAETGMASTTKTPAALQNMPETPAAPAAAQPQTPAGVDTAEATHAELVAGYEALDDAELKSTIAAVDKEMEDRKLIDRANSGEISDEERAELKLLLKKFSALKEVETLRLLASDP